MNYYEAKFKREAQRDPTAWIIVDGCYLRRIRPDRRPHPVVVQLHAYRMARRILGATKRAGLPCGPALRWCTECLHALRFLIRKTRRALQCRKKRHLLTTANDKKSPAASGANTTPRRANTPSLRNGSPNYASEWW